MRDGASTCPARWARRRSRGESFSSASPGLERKRLVGEARDRDCAGSSWGRAGRCRTFWRQQCQQ
eukprot:9394738-Lingulodinium_polyedra.AAC.1